MSSDQQDISNLINGLKKNLLQFTDNYAKAVKNGADMAGQQIIEAAEQLDQPTDIPASKLIAALKNGVRHAGQHMIHSGIDFFGQTDTTASGQKKKKKKK
ncbi:hypothetical protein ACFQI7_16850 [Paenibacillus allorhizosphaerae]|uniref:Uncharacterized protein n=1 Tax=Paenibacillus allorhizosphaerae TaxID=2849866 RepID=A0ABN7TGR9_9BACL|nr:hypothetical protein [Paenibacillus allorhizosphaerae]CAG7630559.1 hypothetical protein PAECIP111802_01649 [Paenibacillus allorhizosphaerae]